MTAFQAAEFLDKQLRGTEGYDSIGVGEYAGGFALYVYAKSPLVLSSECRGYRVFARNVGNVGALSSKIDRMRETILDPRGQALAGEGFNVTSQFGEDGFIDKALRLMGRCNCWCFEVGAGDGRFYSNTHRLWGHCYNAVLIEADDEAYARLAGYTVNDRVHAVHERIGPDSLDRILDEHGVPNIPDLGVIDIDGQDYWCWRGMKRFAPRLMLVEYSHGNDDYLAPLDGKGQTGINPLIALAKEKGYFPLLKTFCNVLFCREDSWPVQGH